MEIASRLNGVSGNRTTWNIYFYVGCVNMFVITQHMKNRNYFDEWTKITLSIPEYMYCVYMICYVFIETSVFKFHHTKYKA